MNEEQFLQGIDEFNRQMFFECHDTLEDLWHGTRGNDKLFLQGLIQVSVGFYHLLNRNFKGAKSQWSKAAEKLERYSPSHHNLDVKFLLNELSQWLQIAEQGVRGESVTIDESRIPKIFIH